VRMVKNRKSDGLPKFIDKARSSKAHGNFLEFRYSLIHPFLVLSSIVIFLKIKCR
jgi:hypothetical protein